MAYSRLQKDALLEKVKGGMMLRDACAATGTNHSAVCIWRKTDPVFKQQWEELGYQRPHCQRRPSKPKVRPQPNRPEELVEMRENRLKQSAERGEYYRDISRNYRSWATGQYQVIKPSHVRTFREDFTYEDE